MSAPTTDEDIDDIEEYIERLMLILSKLNESREKIEQRLDEVLHADAVRAAAETGAPHGLRSIGDRQVAARLYLPMDGLLLKRLIEVFKDEWSDHPPQQLIIGAGNVLLIMDPTPTEEASEASEVLITAARTARDNAGEASDG